MRVSVSEMAKLSGVSVRTLHYYDELGLLRPEEVSPDTGYRWYGEQALRRLQQILFYRELDFSLKDIQTILTAPNHDPRQALERQRTLLELKRQRLNRLLGLLDDNLKGERTMEFTPFDSRELDETRAAYAAEAKERWGNTAAWRESQEKELGRSDGQQTAVNEQMEELFRRFADARGGDAAGEAAQTLVAQWQAFVSAHYYQCTNEILVGLGQMYTADERFRTNLDRYGTGTAQFMADAIAAYCAAPKD